MTSWRERILSQIDPALASLFVVRDPDYLFADEAILEAIREKGFEFIRFENPIALRLAYESGYRSAVDRGEEAMLVIATDLSGLGNDDVPFDILERARTLSIGLADLLPNLDPQVVCELAISSLDVLFEAYCTYCSKKLGENETIDFVLRHVFGIVPELVVVPEDLLLLLLRRHYRGQAVPEMFDERLVRLLCARDQFANWPLDRLLSDREYFFDFLQERWIIALDKAVADVEPNLICERAYELACDGPPRIPLFHKDICVYIDNLFLEGILKPISYEHADLIEEPWRSSGIVVNGKADQARRFERLIERLREQLPKPDAHHDKWLQYARLWAEAVKLLASDSGLRSSAEYQTLRSEMDIQFTAWAEDRFDLLCSLPSYPPVMVHHIPKFLARKVERNPSCKIALIVVDGMALDQWLSVRDALEESDPDLSFHEEQVLAWVPTITPVSRQAIFSGLIPRMFASSIGSTHRESALWSNFWQERGLGSALVAYQRGLGSGASPYLEKVLEHPKLRILGLVIDKVDKIMHGVQLGTAGMHNQIKQWMAEGYLLNLVHRLLKGGFRVFLTADHGNVEAIGCGRIHEGVVADTRGERVRVYSDPLLRRSANEKCTSSLVWDSKGLPDEYFPLLAPTREAFTNNGNRIVTHGGISLEEVVVPFVEVAQNNGR